MDRLRVGDKVLTRKLKTPIVVTSKAPEITSAPQRKFVGESPTGKPVSIFQNKKSGKIVSVLRGRNELGYKRTIRKSRSKRDVADFNGSGFFGAAENQMFNDTDYDLDDVRSEFDDALKSGKEIRLF
jgi:hypothetical protein